MKFPTGFERRRARVEIVPLIDVVFLLLVFFIYASLSMSVHRGIPLALPRVKEAPVDSRDYLVVSVTAEGKIFVNEEETNLAEVGEKVLRERGERIVPVFVRGDRGAPFGVIVGVLDALRQEGIRDVSIEAEEKERP
ncbi:MAG: biopolymer transporter ExbD [Deltaproteobacteria bacterium]|nr:MAG: biopolymer transporter ExbD [Deltaproteobacteria bacterium]